MSDTHLRATVSQRAVLFDGDGRVLVVRRAEDDGWELPGGRLDSGEDVFAGLGREVREETGLTPELYRPVHAVSWRNDRSQGRYAVYFYGECGESAVELSDEHTEFGWVLPAEAGTKLSDPQETAVENACQVRELRR